MPEYKRVTDDVTPSRHYSIVASSFDPEVHKEINNKDADDQAVNPLTGEPLPPKFLSSSTPATRGQQADDKEN